MVKTRTKKFRGSSQHGRGKKAGRGAGLRGGRGNAGLHKHKYIRTVKWQNEEGYYHFGRRGFKRPEAIVHVDTTLNVGSLGVRFPGASAVNLAEHGYTKLLGAGTPPRAVQVTVASASKGAVAKIEGAGGSVTLLEKEE